MGEAHLIALIDAVDELLGWGVPGEADCGGVDSCGLHSLRRCCGNYESKRDSMMQETTRCLLFT